MMDTMSLQAEQNDLIRMILDVQDLNVLRRIRKAFTQEEAEASRDACARRRSRIKVGQKLKPTGKKYAIL